MRPSLLLSFALLALFACLQISSAISASCPCSDASLCNPITTGARTEVFVFTVMDTNWPNFDWTQITTLALFEPNYDLNVVCRAHSAGARVVWGVDWTADLDQLSNQTARSEWISQQLELVTSTFTDGVNIDFEDPLTSEQSGALTALVQETTQAFHEKIPGSQVTFDVAWSPNCVDGRCFDYVGLSKACDFLFVMSYDTRSQVFTPGPCLAGANSAIEVVQEGVSDYLKLGINPDLLVLGVPWYGYDYNCTSFENGQCVIKEVPFRGANCSDAGGSQIIYSDLMTLFQESTPIEAGWNTVSASPYSDIEIDANVHQYWYDDPNSLAIKSQLANMMNMRGIGMWNADLVNYTESFQASQMWNALKIVSAR